MDITGLRPDVAKGLLVGDTLAVELRPAAAFMSVVCVTMDSGDVVGSLAAFEGLARLLACLEAGVAFEALVEEASPTRCFVHVYRVSP